MYVKYIYILLKKSPMTILSCHPPLNQFNFVIYVDSFSIMKILPRFWKASTKIKNKIKSKEYKAPFSQKNAGHGISIITSYPSKRDDVLLFKFMSCVFLPYFIIQIKEFLETIRRPCKKKP